MRSIVLLLIVLLLASCGEQREVPVTVIVVATATIAPTAAPASTAAPAPTAAPMPTAAPPSTIAPAPTAAPTPAVSLSPAAVVAAFQAAGLEAEDARPLTRDDYGAAPLVGEGVRFLIPSLCEDCGGRVFAVDDVEERDLLANYYRDMSKASAMLFSHVFVRGNIVVQINGDLPDERAAEYARALAALE